MTRAVSTSCKALCEKLASMGFFQREKEMLVYCDFKSIYINEADASILVERL